MEYHRLNGFTKSSYKLGMFVKEKASEEQEGDDESTKKKSGVRGKF